MTPLAATALAQAAHTLHFALIVVGLVGIGLLLLPHVLNGGAQADPRTPEEHRIRDLRHTAEHGMLGTGMLLQAPRRTPRVRARSDTWLPLAIIGSCAAAGIHAAVCPEHLAEGALIGAFFIASTVGQLGWAATALIRGASPRLLRAGIAINAACIGLWLVTRTSGLPFGLLPETEAVGTWDASCVLFEAVVVLTCSYGLQHAPDAETRWAHWTPVARSALVLAGLTLLGLTLFGNGA